MVPRMMVADDRGYTSIETLVLVGTMLAVVGGIGAAALDVGPTGSDDTMSVSDTNVAATSSTATPTSTPTSTEQKNMSHLFER